jgi:hypothetical protein
MTSFYEHGLAERCRMLADHGFVRDENHIWRHRDGRAIGECEMSALIDTAFVRYLSIDGAVAPAMQRSGKEGSKRRKRKSATQEA